MKIKFSFLLLTLLFATSCSVDNDDDSELRDAALTDILEWHLTSVSGGFAGVDIEYKADTVIWIFSVLDDNGNGTLNVKNNNTDDSLEDGLDSGDYSVYIAEYNNQPILYVNGEEYAGFSHPTPEKDVLVINKNINSTGATGSDGFIYTFKKRVVEQ